MSTRAVSLALVSLVLGSSVVTADDAATNEQQLAEWREDFRAIHPDVERGNWSKAEQSRESLEAYVLWPDLRATWFKAKVATASQSATSVDVVTVN